MKQLDYNKIIGLDDVANDSARFIGMLVHYAYWFLKTNNYNKDGKVSRIAFDPNMNVIHIFCELTIDERKLDGVVSVDSCNLLTDKWCNDPQWSLYKVMLNDFNIKYDLDLSIKILHTPKFINKNIFNIKMKYDFNKSDWDTWKKNKLKGDNND